jgi:hypothetical protein
MDDDKIKRQMDFIIEQQARFAEQQARFEEQQARFEEQQEKQRADYEEWRAQHEKDQAQAEALFNERFTMLTDALLSLTRIVERHDEQIAALIERGKESDERLNALIIAVEKFLSGKGDR